MKPSGVVNRATSGSGERFGRHWWWTCCGVLGCGCLGGCTSWLHAPKEAPIDYQSVSTQRPTILTLTPERRTVLVVPSDFNGANSGLRTCPEPPPDVAEALTNAVAAELKGETGGKAQASLALSQSFGSAVSQLFYRTQGAELFRDGTHALCLAWLNDIYKTNDLQAWRADFKYLLDVSSKLIETEVRVRGTPAALPVSTTRVVAPSTVPGRAVSREERREGRETVTPSPPETVARPPLPPESGGGRDDSAPSGGGL